MGQKDMFTFLKQMSASYHINATESAAHEKTIICDIDHGKKEVTTNYRLKSMTQFVKLYKFELV